MKFPSQRPRRKWRIGRKYARAGAHPRADVEGRDEDFHAENTHGNSGEKTDVEIDAVVLVTDRISNDELYLALKENGSLNSLSVIGDAEAPGIIADAVFSGYKVAYEMDGDGEKNVPFRIERVRV